MVLRLPMHNGDLPIKKSVDCYYISITTTTTTKRSVKMLKMETFTMSSTVIFRNLLMTR